MGNAACCQTADPNAVSVMTITDEEQVVQEPAKEAPKEAPKEEVAATPPPSPAKEEEPKEEPKEKLEVVFFSTRDGEKTLNFARSPLGMTFANREPIVVTGVGFGGHAEELGVEIGWQIKKVGGKSITDPEYKDFKVLKDYFNDKIAMLDCDSLFG